MTPLQAERLAVVCEMLTLAGSQSLPAALNSACARGNDVDTAERRLRAARSWAAGTPMPEPTRRAILDALGLLWATLGGARGRPDDIPY